MGRVVLRLSWLLLQRLLMGVVYICCVNVVVDYFVVVFVMMLWLTWLLVWLRLFLLMLVLLLMLYLLRVNNVVVHVLMLVCA